MMRFIYNFLALVVLIFLWPFLLNKHWKRPKGLRERLGILKPGGENPSPVWFHAASLGEVGVLASIIRSLKQSFPPLSPYVSTMTQTGLIKAERMIKEPGYFFLLPLDLPLILRRAIKKIRPQALILIETEFWPNLILEAKRFGCKIAVVNGRISERSFPRYLLFKSFFKKILVNVDLWAMQSSQDRDRIIKLGVDPLRVYVTGNAKYDLLETPPSNYRRREMRKIFFLPEGLKVIVAGSTRPREEEILLSAYQGIWEKFPNSLLILAPRHPERFREVANLIRQKGMRLERRSTPFFSPLDFSSRPVVLLLDTMGELLQVYAVADVAFVGGSLFPYGGHNPLEPASLGIPVFFGPFMENVGEPALLLKKRGGGVEVKNERELKEGILRLFSNLEELRERGKSAFQVVETNRGVTQRIASLLLENHILS